MKTYLFLIALILIGCGGKKTDKQTPATSRTSINRTMLQGIWWSPEMPQSAAFQVKDSTFYYPDAFAERKYELKDDSLFVFFDDGSVSASVILKLTPDTLILSTGGMEELYMRTEPQAN